MCVECASISTVYDHLCCYSSFDTAANINVTGILMHLIYGYSYQLLSANYAKP